MPLYSLRTRLILLVTVALMPVFGLVTYNSLQRQQESLQQARQDMVTTTRLAALSYERTARGAHQLLQAITSAPVIKRNDMPGCTTFMQDLRSNFPEYSNLGLADRDGRVMCDSFNRTQIISIADRAYFQQAVASRAFVISNYLVGRVSGNAALAFAIPNFSHDQQVRGIAFAAMDLNRLAKDNPLGPDQKARLVVTDREGTVIASGDPVATPLGSRYGSKAALATVAGVPPQTLDTLDADGFEVMQATVAIGDGTTAGLFIHGSLRKADITRADQRRLNRSLIWLFCFTFIGALVANWLGIQTIVTPSVRLLRKVQALAGGHDPRAPAALRRAHSADELAELSAAVDHLARTLDERQTARDVAENKIQQRLRQNEGMTALAMEITQTSALIDIFQSACRHLSEAMGAELTAVMQPVPGGQHLQLVAGSGWVEGTVGSALLSTAPDALVGWTLNAKAPVWLADVHGETRFTVPDLLREPPITCGLQVSIQMAGKPWGVLGVYTRQPEIRFMDEAHVIQSVAYLLSVAIDRLAAEQAVAKSLHSMNDAQRMAQLGSWELALPGNTLSWSNEVFRIVGVQPDGFDGSDDAFMQRVHPDDRAAMRAARTAALTGSAPMDIEHRIVRSDGEIRYVRERGERVCDAQGKAVALAGTVQDITTRKNVELQLARNQALLQMASRISQLGAWRMALPSRELVMSMEARQVLGVRTDAPFCADDGYSMYAPEYIETLRERITACAHEGITFDVEAEIIRHDGERAWVRVIGEQDHDADGLVVGVQGAIQDISARKDTERQLGKLSAQLITTLESITDAFFLLDDQWQFLFVNPQAARLLHRSRESLAHSNLWDAFPGTTGSLLDQKYRQVLLDRQPQSFEFYYPPYEAWYHINAYATDEGLAIYFHDITTEHQSAEQLQLLETAVSRLNDIVIITDLPEHPGEVPRIVFVNAAFEKKSGYQLEEVLGHPASFFQGAQTSVAEIKRVARDMRRLQPVRSEMIGYPKQGEPLWVEMEIVPIFNSAGRATHWVTVCRDISERKAAQQAILQLNADLENRVAQRTAELRAANEELDAFSYSVSHDLRSPLSTIDGFSLMLQKAEGDKISTKGQHYLRRIRTGTQQMSELIEGLLALARLSREALKLQPVDLSAIARRVVRECRDQQPARQVDVTVEDALHTNADPLQMRVLLQNLIGNAWKFTALQTAASIHIGVDTGPDGTSVYFVKDNGAGFDMAFSAKLFAIFERLHAVADFSGTGVGLAIVKRVIDRHGGRVWAHSTEGQGATF
ncbi:MAG: PAS domain S-box protein [Polaromonas sp.]